MPQRPQADYDKAWLTYARGVLGDGALRTCCQFPVPPDDPLHDRILWPGYLGSNYAKARVLFVGAMHNAGELFTPEIIALAGEASQWTKSPDSPANSARYLEAVREAYLTSISTWTRGAVWGRFNRIRKKLNLDWSEIAFTNLAKCAEISDAGDSESKKRYTKRINGCEGSLLTRMPLRELQPLAVFVACDIASVRDTLAESSQIPIRRSYHNTHGYYWSYDASGDKIIVAEKNWLGLDARRYADLRINEL
jgi:hypothetical protein